MGKYMQVLWLRGKNRGYLTWLDRLGGLSERGNEKRGMFLSRSED